MNKKLKILLLEETIKSKNEIIDFYLKQNQELLDLVSNQETKLIDLNVQENTILNDLQNELLYVKSDEKLTPENKKWLIRDINNMIRKLRK